MNPINNKRFIKPSQRRPVFQQIPGTNIKHFVGFEGDAHIKRNPTTPGLGNTHRRSQGLGALGVADRHSLFPTKLGTPGSFFQGDYDESEIWGTNSPSDTVTAPIDPSVAMPEVSGPQEVDPGISIPFGISVIPWRNPTTMQSVPILATTPSNTPVLSLNMQRNALLVQNNSTATSPDIPPTFYIGFNSVPQVGLSLAVPPLAGILFDIITPRDSIFVVQAGGTGASVVVAGVVLQGTYAPI